MHQALYRKWRSKTFDDVCGQDHITSILQYEVEHNTVSHAYLFCGSRGTGKTTCAKILAKAVNCLHPVNGSPCCTCEACQMIESGAATDVLEMDAASNNGVDNVRDIRDEVVYAPNALKYRVYIIDEVHMLSGSAFNALLKTLEEPPAHVIFILATTELQKLPATIISRCQRFDFRRIATPVIAKRLAYIAENEKIDLTPEAATELAKLAQGGMRDAISLLELCAGSLCTITPQLVHETVGITGRETVMQTVKSIATRDFDTLYGIVQEVVASSVDIGVFWQDVITLYRDLLIVKTASDAASYLDLADAEQARLQELAKLFTKETILYHITLLENAAVTMNSSNALKRVTAETTLTRMCDPVLSTQPEAILARLSQLEETVAMGGTHAYIVREAAEEKPKRDESAAPVQTTQAMQTKQPNAEIGGAAKEADKLQSLPSDTPKKQPAVAENQRVLHPIRTWCEIAERVGGKDAMLAPFLKSAKAFTAQDGRIHIRLDNAFALTMIGQGNTRALLKSALSVTLKREINDAEILYEILPQTETGCAIDEIIEELNNENNTENNTEGDKEI